MTNSGIDHSVALCDKLEIQGINTRRLDPSPLPPARLLEIDAATWGKAAETAQLQQWRDQMLVGLEPKAAKRAETKRIQELEKELRRKDKALAETAALLVLKKKAQAIWGDEDDDTTGERGSRPLS